MAKEKKGSGYKVALERFRSKLRKGKISASYTVKKGQTVSDILADVYGDFIKTGTDAQWYARDLLNMNNIRALKAGMKIRLVKPRRYNPDYSPFDAAEGPSGASVSGTGRTPRTGYAAPPPGNARPTRPGRGKTPMPASPRSGGTTTSNTGGQPAVPPGNARPNRPGRGKPPPVITKQARNTKRKAQGRKPIWSANDPLAAIAANRAARFPAPTGYSPSAALNAALNAGIRLPPGGQPYNAARPPYTPPPVARPTRPGRGKQAQPPQPGGFQLPFVPGIYPYIAPDIVAQERDNLQQAIDNGILPNYIPSYTIDQTGYTKKELIDMGWIEGVVGSLWAPEFAGPSGGGGGLSRGAYVPMSGFVGSGWGYGGGGGGGGGGGYSPIGYSPYDDPYGYATSFGLVSWRI